MSQDDIISMLMDETFQSNESSPRIVDDADLDFDVMTKVSRLPVTALRSKELRNGILHFDVLGNSLHVPQDHLGSKHAAPLAKVIGGVLNQSLDRFVVVNSCSSVWLFVWDSAEDFNEEEIHKIFAKTSARAA